MWQWPIRDTEAEEIDKRLGHKTRSEEFSDMANYRNIKLSPERERDIEDEGYHDGYSMKIPSWGGPYRSGTPQHKAWLEGWEKGRRDREGRIREGRDD